MRRQVYPSPTPSPRLSEPQPKIPELQRSNARKSTWEISWWTLREGGSIRNARLAGIGGGGYHGNRGRGVSCAPDCRLGLRPRADDDAERLHLAGGFDQLGHRRLDDRPDDRESGGRGVRHASGIWSDRLARRRRRRSPCLVYSVCSALRRIPRNEEDSNHSPVCADGVGRRRGRQPGRAARSAGPAALRTSIERRFEVLQIRDGVVLKPRDSSSGVQSIEITNDLIAIDGQPATGPELRQKLGAEDADLVRQFSYLTRDQQRDLFSSTPQPSAPSVLPPAPPPPPEPAPFSRFERRNRGRRDGDRVQFGSSIHIREDEVVDGDVVAHWRIGHDRRRGARRRRRGRRRHDARPEGATSRTTSSWSAAR